MKYNKINMDAFYASRWKDSNLARGAFDARLAIAGGSGNEKDADSPAVDAGSKDFLNGGTTKTEKVSGNDQPDNNAPFELGGYDNYDPQNGNAIVAWESSSVTSGNNDDLDVGYHYGGAGYDSDGDFSIIPDDYETAVTLRHPNQAVSYYLNLPPEGYHDVASSSYNGEQRTIACMSYMIEGDVPGNHHVFITYNRFRSGNQQSLIKSFSDETFDFTYSDDSTDEYNIVPFVEELTMNAGKGSSSGDMNEPIYLGGVVEWSPDADENLPYSNVKSEFMVWRYDPDPEGWTLIAHDEFLYDDEDNTYHSRFLDVSLAADGEDVIISWVQNDTDHNASPETHDRDIYGYRIQNASTLTEAQKIADFASVSNRVNLSPINPQGENKIDADWDPHPDVQCPRITWTDYDGCMKTKTARIELDQYGNIAGLSNDETLSGSSNDTQNPSISSNRFCLTGITYDESGIYESFTSFTYGTSLKRSKVNVDILGDDNWYSENDLSDSNVYNGETCVTYRAFGTPRQAWISGGKVVVDEKYLTSSNSSYIKIITNITNNTDIFCSYNQHYSISGDSYDYITIRQLEP